MRKTLDTLFYTWTGWCAAWFYYTDIVFWKLVLIYILGIIISFFISMIVWYLDTEFKEFSK